MSLEARIESLENAMVALTEVLKAATSGTAITAAAGKASTAAKDDDEKGEAAKPTTRRRTTAAKDDKPKTPTVKALQDFATKFLDEAEGNEDAYGERRSQISKLCKKYDVKKLSDADEDDRQDIIDALKDFAEENPVEAEGGI